MAVKNSSDTVECYGCHQYVLVCATQEISIADGPEEFCKVPMCDECAEIYEKDTPDYETQSMETIDECASKETARVHKLL